MKAGRTSLGSLPRPTSTGDCSRPRGIPSRACAVECIGNILQQRQRNILADHGSDPEDMPITFVTLSNSIFGWIKAGQRSGFGERFYNVEFTRTDHAAVAAAGEQAQGLGQGCRHRSFHPARPRPIPL